MNLHELDTYKLSDAVKFHNRLNPRIWGADEQLLPEVRSKLLEIAADFQEFLGLSDLDVQDITLSGSNAAYSYTPHSDIDLHLVVNVPGDEVYRELFNAKKSQYNDMHDIRVRGADVELYVQPADEQVRSLGEYSIKDNQWLQVPRRKRAEIDQNLVRHKYEDLMERIKSALKEDDSDRVEALAEKIKAMRQSGLDQHGEFGPENLAFKMLRTQGWIKKLYDHRTAARDRELSLKEQPSRPFIYGFKLGQANTEPGTTPVSSDDDYHNLFKIDPNKQAETPPEFNKQQDYEWWLEQQRKKKDLASEGHQGQPYSSEDGVAPSTCMFLNEEEDQEAVVHEFIQWAADRLGIDQLPEIFIHTDPKWSVEEHSFGRYEPDTHSLHVNMANRHLFDILRTTAHELVHCRQNQHHPLPANAGKTGSRWENEAHAKAGVIMRDFADAHPELFDTPALQESLDEGWKNWVAGATMGAAALGAAAQPAQQSVQDQISLTNKYYTALVQRAKEDGRELDTRTLNVLKAKAQDAAAAKLQNQKAAGPTVSKDNFPTQSSERRVAKDIHQFESASGYIPTKKQARDPRYAMALTVDIKPGQTGKEANKLALDTDRQGKPGLLMKTANLREGKMAELDMDLEDPEITDRQFEKMYGMTRKEARELFSQTDMWAFPELRDPNQPLHEQGVAEGLLNESAIFLNPNTVIVGQEHGRPLNLSPETLKRVQSIAAKHGAWYEGNGADRAFTKGVIDNYVGSFDDDVAKIASPNDPKWLYVLFANVDANNRVQRVGVNPKDTIFNRLLATAQDNSFQGIGFTPQALKKFLSLVSEGKYDFVKMSQQPATQENLTRFLKAGEALMWPSNWEQYPNRAGKIAKAATVDARDQYLASRKAGVYVVGSGHLKAVQQISGKQGVAEGAENYNGLQFSIVKDSPYLRVNAFAPGTGRALAQVDFKIDNKNELHPEDLHVEEHYRGQGIAATMYDYVKSKGYKIHRSWSQTDDGSAFWDKHRGEERVWEQGVAEDKPKSYGYGSTPLTQEPGGIEDALGNQEATGPEFPPQMPAGTTKIDVSDLTDWYRLGMDISDMDDADPKDYNQGPPQTVIVFPSDEAEQGYLKQFKRLGLKTHDMDPDVEGGEDLYGKHLRNKLSKELREFKEQDLFEIKMSPSNLKAEAAKTGAMAGMEFEMIVPNADVDEEPNYEPDYDQDRRTRSFSDIRDFFYDGDYNGRRDVDEVEEELQDQFGEWLEEQIDEAWESDGFDYLKDYIESNDYFDEEEANEEATNALQAEYGDDISPEDFQKMLDAIVKEKFDEFVQDQWDNQGRYYDDALEQFRDEQSGDIDESDWLQEHYPYMTDIQNNFDIAWPYYIDTNEGNGETDIAAVADDFSDAVGMKVNWSSSYHGGRREPNAYVVEPDGSLTPDNSGDGGLEFVSPPMPIDKMIDQLNKVKAWAGDYGCYTNKSTGLHINISVPNYDLDKLDYVKLALLLGDKYILDQYGRSSNTYAKSALGKVQDLIKRDPSKGKELLDKMRGHMEDLATKSIHSGSTDKYTSINTKTGYIEFRSPGGDWLDANFDKIENTLLRFTVALSAAMDPQAYREEYLKKLYKLLEPVAEEAKGLFGKGAKDTVKYFADYVAGKTPKAALRSFVKQAQLERKIKKDPTGGQKYWWSVTNPANNAASIEVVATSREEAIATAVEPGNYPEWAGVRSTLQAKPLRPYDTSPVKASLGAAQPAGGMRPTNPDGNYVIFNNNSRAGDPPAYRFMAADNDDADIVLLQWSREHPGYWEVHYDPSQRLGQPPIPGSTLDLQRQRAAAAQQSTSEEPAIWYVSVIGRPGTEIQVRARNAGEAQGQAHTVRPDIFGDNEGNIRASTVPVSQAAAQQQPAPGPLGAGRELVGWEIRIDGEPVHTLSGIGNNQGDANRLAQQWILRQDSSFLRQHQGGEVEVVPAWREA